MTLHQLNCQACDLTEFDEDSAVLNRIANAHGHATHIRSYPIHGETVEFTIKGVNVRMEIEDLNEQDGEKWLGGYITEFNDSALNRDYTGDYYEIRPHEIDEIL